MACVMAMLLCAPHGSNKVPRGADMDDALHKFVLDAALEQLLHKWREVLQLPQIARFSLFTTYARAWKPCSAFCIWSEACRTVPVAGVPHQLGFIIILLLLRELCTSMLQIACLLLPADPCLLQRVLYSWLQVLVAALPLDDAGCRIWLILGTMQLLQAGLCLRLPHGPFRLQWPLLQELQCWKVCLWLRLRRMVRQTFGQARRLWSRIPRSGKWRVNITTGSLDAAEGLHPILSSIPRVLLHHQVPRLAWRLRLMILRRLAACWSPPSRTPRHERRVRRREDRQLRSPRFQCIEECRPISTSRRRRGWRKMENRTLSLLKIPSLSRTQGEWLMRWLSLRQLRARRAQPRRRVEGSCPQTRVQAGCWISAWLTMISCQSSPPARETIAQRIASWPAWTMALREARKIKLDSSFCSHRPTGKMSAAAVHWLYPWFLVWMHYFLRIQWICQVMALCQLALLFTTGGILSAYSRLACCVCHLFGPLGSSARRSISQSTTYLHQERQAYPLTSTRSTQLKSRVGPKSHDCSRVTRCNQINFLFWLVILQLCVCTRAAAVDARVAPIVHQGAGASGLVWGEANGHTAHHSTVRTTVSPGLPNHSTPHQNRVRKRAFARAIRRASEATDHSTVYRGRRCVLQGHRFQVQEARRRQHHVHPGINDKEICSSSPTHHHHQPGRPRCCYL